MIYLLQWKVPHLYIDVQKDLPNTTTCLIRLRKLVTKVHIRDLDYRKQASLRIMWRINPVMAQWMVHVLVNYSVILIENTISLREQIVNKFLYAQWRLKRVGKAMNCYDKISNETCDVMRITSTRILNNKHTKLQMLCDFYLLSVHLAETFSTLKNQ